MLCTALVWSKAVVYCINDTSLLMDKNFWTPKYTYCYVNIISFNNGVCKMLLLFTMSDSGYSNNKYEYVKAKRSVKYSELKIMEAKYSSKVLSNTIEIKKQNRLLWEKRLRAGISLRKLLSCANA